MAQGGIASDVVSKVELSFSCTKLRDLDVLSKSDPMCVVYSKLGAASREWTKVGRTEMIKDNLNPKFAKTIVMDYYFEEVQYVKVVVYDVDSEKHIGDFSRHDLLGEVEVTLAEIISAGQTLSKSLRVPGKHGNFGKVHIQGEEVADNKFDISLQLAASNLDKKDFFGKSDPYVEICKAQEGSSPTVVYRSETVKKTLSPKWKSTTISVQKLCSGDWDRTLFITVWDWNSSGDPDLIGKTSTSLREICSETGGSVRNLPLINPELKAKKKGKYHNSGILSFETVKATPIDGFVDYIRGGCQMNLIVAIDFTGSNGKPSDPNSLHYMAPNYENEYMYAIRTVGSVLAPYDTDQKYPCFGFGAKVPPSYQVSHCFALNGNERDPEVTGVDGILGAYQFAVSQVQLYGPTNFSSILDRAMAMAKEPLNQQQQSYYILLVITDGVITDMKQTVDRVVRASQLPLSVVIVGVGGADFSNMETLDADDCPLVDSQGQRMARDIVQFVPLRQFKSQRGANFSLAKETLAEIPGQLLSFMKSRKIKANPPVLRRQETTMSMAPTGQYGAPASGQPYNYPGGNPQGMMAPQYAGGPTPYPAAGPTPYPTGGPTPYPTGGPTPYPTGGPTPYPTGGPTPYPTGGPTPYPTGGPTPTPTGGPTPSAPQAPGSQPPSADAPPPYPI